MVVRFYNKNNELLNKFTSRGIETKTMNLKGGFIRYFRILFYTYSICLKYKPKSILSFPLGWHSFIAIGSKLAGVKTICAHAGNPVPKIKNTKAFGARAVYGNELCTDSMYYCSYNASGKQRCFRDLTDRNCIGWCTGDVIKICMDLDQYRVKFYLNGNRVRKAMSLEPGQTYYPIIAFSGNCLYQVVY